MRKQWNYKKWVCIAGISLCCVGSMAFFACRSHNTVTAPGQKTSEEGAGQHGKSAEDRGKENTGRDGNGAGKDETDGAGEAGAENTPPVSLINPAGNTLAERFQTPEGFARMDQINGFAEFLENYPLYKDGKRVKLYDGTDKGNQDAHAAVFKMKVVDGDLQQCADSVMRLYAEYFYESKQYDKMKFHLVNGFSVDYSKWRQGMRVSVDGDDTSWVSSEPPSDSPQTFEKYLRLIFAYASTLSMEQESKKIKKEQIRAGDIFINGGSPGHVVMVLDVCENSSGDKAFLLGQGYMPAQQFHVLKNPLHEDNPWYYVSELQYPLQTPECRFEQGSLRRPEYDR